jgi:hypothetical protein
MVVDDANIIKVAMMSTGICLPKGSFDSKYALYQLIYRFEKELLKNVNSF